MLRELARRGLGSLAAASEATLANCWTPFELAAAQQARQYVAQPQLKPEAEDRWQPEPTQAPVFSRGEAGVFPG